jgi:alcohol dehydrogenase
MRALAEQTFVFNIPTVSLLGVGAAKQAGAEAKKAGGKKALLVTDKGLVKLGMAGDIQANLEEAGLQVVLFDGAEPNPTDKNVEAGLKVYQDNGCDLIVSLGGGSSHDCAKAVGVVATNGGSIRDYEGVGKITKPTPPKIAINTTAGTGSEMTFFCVVTNTDTHVKMAIGGSQITPTVAINDPLLMVGLPPALTAATGMDALTHAVEAYVSILATPATDACGLQAIELIAKWLRKAVANGQDIEARERMAFAEYLAGMAFNNAFIGHVHAMAHQLGGFYNLPHGVCNAVLLPVVEQYNLIACPERFRDIAVALGEDVTGLSVMDAGQKAIEAMRRLAADVGIPAGLAELGVKESDIPTLAQNASKDVCCLTNPRIISIDEIMDLYRAAM